MGNCNTKACSWRVLPLRYLYLSIGLCVCAQSCPILCNPWTVARQAPLSMGSPRQEYSSGLPFPSPEGSSQCRDGTCISRVVCIGRYWSGLLFPSPGYLPNPRIEHRSPTLQVILYHLSHQGSPRWIDVK